MARLWSSGFELNGFLDWGSGGSITVQGTTVRSGSYAAQSNLTAVSAKAARHPFKSSANNGPLYFRTYLRINTAPSAENRIIALSNADSTTGSQIVYLTIDSGGVLKLYDEDGQITGTSTLSTATWYRIEIEFDRTAAAGSHIVRARVDGTEFAGSATRDLSVGIWVLVIGSNLANEDQTTGAWFFDDIAINDNVGSFQNSYPGEGEIIHLRPNAAGDNSDWTRGGADSGANWSQVDEVTPNDATDYVQSNTNNQIDDYNLDATPAALESTDVINVVQLGARYRLDDATGADPNFVFRIKASSGGTVEETINQSPNSANWASPSFYSPKNYNLTLYDLPGASTTAWTRADLDTAQIGVRQTATDTHNVQVSAIWLLVEHKPGAGGGDLTVSTSDTVTLSEALTLLVNSYISTSETVTLSEVASILLVHLVSSEDTITLSETVSALLVHLVSTSETVALSEALTLEVFTSISVEDTVTLSEAVTTLVTSFISVSDTVTLTEDALALVVSLISTDDTVTLSESASALVISLISVSETVTLEEALNLLVTSFLSASETITLSEDISLTVANAGDTLISVSDTVTLSEAVTLLVLSFINASDTVTLSEALDLLVTSFIAASETITLSEDTSLSIVSGATFSPNVSDTITLSEAVSLFVLVEISVSETITLSELASLILVSFINSSETVTLSEAITALLVSLISASETVTLSEAVTLFVLATIQASETITLSEAAAVQLINLISASETVTLSETAAALLVSLISTSDTVTLSETTSATVGTGINVSETITLTEQPTVTVTGAGGELLISVSETITLTESVSAIILIIGLMRVTFSAKRPGATFSGKRPSITFTSEE